MVKRIPKSLALISVVAAILALVAGWFYWYEFRPTRIKTTCDKLGKEFVLDLKIGREKYEELKGPGKDLVITAAGRDENYAKVYQSCLHSKGL